MNKLVIYSPTDQNLIKHIKMDRMDQNIGQDGICVAHS